jgi:hypothetical protein
MTSPLAFLMTFLLYEGLVRPAAVWLLFDPDQQSGKEE